MTRGPAAVVLLLIIAAVVAGAVFLGASHEPDGGKEYSIGYVLNGGILPEDSAEKYTGGEYASLPLPSKTGAVFCGWFEDPELTEPLGAILPSRSGDITLYASFSEPVTGKRASMNISGYSESYRYPIAGTAVYDYISFADGGYYVREYSSLSGYVTQNRDESSWRSFIYDSDSVYAGNKILNGNYFGTGNGSYTCQIWTSGADTFYVYNSVYLLEKETITPSYRYTAVMNSFEDMSFDYSFKPDVIVWYGTSAEVPETAEIGKPLTLTASGDCFAGWYSGGVKITDSRTLEIGKADPETAYECCSSMEPFKDFESFYALADYQVRYPVIVADHVGNVIYSGNSHYSADYPGLYTITESSEGTRHAFRILIEGSKSSLFSWNYGGNYSITLEQNSGNVFSYPAEKSCRSGNIDDYFTVNSPDIRDLAAKLAPYKTDMDDREFAEFVLKFVQSIPASGNTAWKYPSETLWDKSGSSSDRSILYVTIMRALGYDTAVAVSDGPVISCIALKPSKTDTVVSHGGKSYILAAVSGDYGIGGTADLPSGLAVIPVTAEPESVPDVTGNEYSVTYVLNGGTLPGYAASSYIAGKYAELPLPENGDKFFEGWYKDALCTVPAGAILPSDSGDLTLYASWTDELTGKGFESEVTGKSTSVIFSRQYSGTASWKYLAFSGGAYYIERYTSVSARTFFGFGNSSLINETDYYWTDEGGEEKFYYRGNADVKSSVFGTVTCEIWESEDSVEYVYRSFYPLVIETESSGIRFTYTLSRTLEFEPETEFVPTVYAEYGISVDMPPVVKIGESFALAASGAQFSGWYRNGTLATDSLVLTEDRATPDTKYEARSSSEPLIYNEKTIFFEDFGLKSPVTITDENGREYVRSTSATFNDNVSGNFVLIDSSEPVPCILRIFREKTSQFSVSWEFGNAKYSMSFAIKYSDVNVYSQDTDRASYRTYDDVKKYFTVKDPYVQLACSELKSYRGTMDDRDFASFVMRFVQTIPYQYDEVSRSAYEFWKYPAETFWDGGGDCEDSSILYATLMKAMGYDTALLVFSDHAMAGIHFENDSLNYGKNVAVKDGKKYVYVETTSDGVSRTDPDGYQLGDIFSDDYIPSKIRNAFIVRAEI